jgi:hypothetical protein
MIPRQCAHDTPGGLLLALQLSQVMIVGAGVSSFPPLASVSTSILFFASWWWFFCARIMIAKASAAHGQTSELPFMFFADMMGGKTFLNDIQQGHRQDRLPATGQRNDLPSSATSAAVEVGASEEDFILRMAHVTFHHKKGK